MEEPKAKGGIYYWMLKEGNGRLINVTDTLTVFYKGYLLNDGTVFDQTDSIPRTFPLSRLIKGWQTGLSGTKTGSKVKLLIPSGQGYWIRTRSAKIPPNFILVFEIETVDSASEAGTEDAVRGKDAGKKRKRGGGQRRGASSKK